MRFLISARFVNPGNQIITTFINIELMLITCNMKAIAIFPCKLQARSLFKLKGTG